MEEQWRPVVGFEGYYEVSDHGRVRSCERLCRNRWGVRRKIARIMAANLTGQRRRYLALTLCVDDVKVRRYVHLLVLEAFEAPRQPTLEARHLNGKSTDNRAVNLTWGTPDQNREDKARHGTQVRGSTHGQARLRETDIPVIRAEFASGVGVTAIARRHAVSPGAIKGIIYGSNGRRSWTHV
jgi:hypothetical protein